MILVEFSLKCGYLKADIVKELNSTYDDSLGKLVNMITHPENWIISLPDFIGKPGRIGRS